MLVLILRGKGSFVPAALMLIVPVLVGLMGVVDGMMVTFQEIAMSSAAPRPSELAQGVGTSLVMAWDGIWLAIPGLLLAARGASFAR